MAPIMNKPVRLNKFKILKLLTLPQAGIMERLENQYEVLKFVDTEKLEPLKLEHFYIVLIGICLGTFLGSVSFAAEVCAKKKMRKPPPQRKPSHPVSNPVLLKLKLPQAKPWLLKLSKVLMIRKKFQF